MDGNVVLVTGAARGIGRGIARAFVEAGASVMLADLGPKADAWGYALSGETDLQNTAAELSAIGSVQSTHLDVTDPASCDAAVAATLQAFGRLDVLVNNAGVVQSGALEEFPEEHWDQVFAVNTKGLFLMSRAAVGALKQNAPSCIINTASIAGKQGYPNMSAYCGSKFAAIGITQSLAAELAPANVRVNAICPGMVGTAMWLEHLLPGASAGSNENNEAQFETMMQQTIPLGRPQTPEDMGAAALYLATAPNVTGVALSVAGGFEMQ